MKKRRPIAEIEHQFFIALPSAVYDRLPFAGAATITLANSTMTGKREENNGKTRRRQDKKIRGKTRQDKKSSNCGKKQMIANHLKPSLSLSLIVVYPDRVSAIAVACVVKRLLGLGLGLGLEKGGEGGQSNNY
jgi:hypothetical protein